MPGSSRAREIAAGPGRLNPATVVDAALDLIARNGLEGLSMRALGQALGVEAMSLYHWFPAKERLLDAIADRLIAKVELPPLPATADTWRRWMTQVARAYRRMGLAHPRAFPLIAGRRFLSPGAIVFIQTTIAANRIAGFDLRQAARLTRTVGAAVNGIVLAELAAPALPPPAFAKSRRAEPERAGAAPPALEEKDWNEVLRFFSRPELDGAFEYGLGCLLDGALQTLRGARHNRRRRTPSSG
jgi:AcrR family transcriptional regulator